VIKFYLARVCYALWFLFETRSYVLKCYKFFIALTARGHKKQVTVKGLGYRAEFFASRNRQFLNFKISYSHKVAIPIYLGVFLLRLKNNVILFESKDQAKLSAILNLLFRLKPYNVYKQKGIFLKQAPLFIPKPSKKKV